MEQEQTLQAYAAAKKAYAAWGIDTDAAIEEALQVPVSIHCWQGDDVAGFLAKDGAAGGGIMATGNFPGKAQNGEQLRADMDAAFRFIPGNKKVNLHAIYAESDTPCKLEDIDVKHFAKWASWAKENGYGLDFNPTCFAHPLAASGYTLASCDSGIRAFWIEHIKRTRKIADYLAAQTGSVCVNNIWVPDGEKDDTVLRGEHRKHLLDSLDEILSVKYDKTRVADTVEPKLFGIGSESFVAGSHEFYLLYALSRGIVPCLDMGHFHPTESVADKISSLRLYFDKVQIHTSRGVRWDSDHVVVLNDELRALMHEIARSDAYRHIFIALDYFDGSINRLMAWIVGANATRKAILESMLSPIALLRSAEREGKLGRRLALQEEAKSMPSGAVWNMLLARSGIPSGAGWIDAIEAYEQAHLLQRG